MTKRRLRQFVSAAIVLFVLGTGLKWLIGNSGTPPDDRVKAPGESTGDGLGCATAGCHSAGTVANNSSDLALTGLPASYTLGQLYSLTFTISNDVAGNNGFEVGISTGSGRIGGWSSAGTASQISGNYWKHNGPTTATSWTVNWTAPVVNVGTITFYAAANKGGAAAAGTLHFKNWSVPPAPITATTGTPTGLKVTAIDNASITLGWTDNANDENGFNIVAATGGLFGSVGANVTSFQITGLSPNTLIQAKIAAFNAGGASTSTTLISSYTLANPPTNLSILSGTGNSVTIAWSSNSNTGSTAYEVSQAANNAFSTGVSTPVPFSSSLTSTAATVSGLTPGGTYFFRVRAQNGDGVATTFSATITTVTPPGSIVISTGGLIDAGAASLTADAGVTVTSFLSNGATQQIFSSTYNAIASYSNGFLITLPPGQTTVTPSASGLVLTSSQTVPIQVSGETIVAGSGTVTLQNSASSIVISLSTDSAQTVQTSVSTGSAKTISISLNPPSGEIKLEVPPAALPQSANLRLKLPDTIPSDSSSIGKLKGVGIGAEIVLDKPIQPVRSVPITLTYRDSDVAGLNIKGLTCSRFDEDSKSWTLVPTTVDSALKRVTGRTAHFSKFQIMTLSPSADISNVKVFPNPFRPSKGHTEIKFVNLPESATVKIYTMLGQRVRELTADSTGRAVWDAKNNAGKDVVSDIYLAIVEGAGDRKILKVGVQR